LVAVGTDDDDMVIFLKSLGLKGAVGFLELSITGVPLIHVVAAGIHLSIHLFIFVVACVLFILAVVIIEPMVSEISVS